MKKVKSQSFNQWDHFKKDESIFDIAAKNIIEQADSVASILKMSKNHSILKKEALMAIDKFIIELESLKTKITSEPDND